MLTGVLEVLVGIPELGLPLLGIALVLALAAAPFYIAYHASRAFAPEVPSVPAAAEVVFLPERPAEPARTLDAACPYCGTCDHEPVRTCPTCAVPHHAACWDENRGCTVYACPGDAPRPGLRASWRAGRRAGGHGMRRA